MVWYQTFDSVFFLGVLGATAGVVGLCLKNCVRTKCNSIDLCCGFLKIERDVGAETREEIRALELGITSPSLPNSSFLLNTPTRPARNTNAI